MLYPDRCQTAWADFKSAAGTHTANAQQQLATSLSALRQRAGEVYGASAEVIGQSVEKISARVENITETISARISSPTPSQAAAASDSGSACTPERRCACFPQPHGTMGFHFEWHAADLPP